MQKIKFILKLILVFLLLSAGAASYYLYDNISVLFGKPLPSKVLCIKGIAFKQIDPSSTVYLKTDVECYSTEKKVIYAM